MAVGAAVRAQQTGEAMLETNVRGDLPTNGNKFGTASILLYSDAYRNHKSLLADLTGVQMVSLATPSLGVKLVQLGASSSIDCLWLPMRMPGETSLFPSRGL